jgi:hypothetical protein
MTPQDLLAEGDRLLTTVVPGIRGRWPRACAWLLPRYADQAVAAQARPAWLGLARATHRHAYDLAPTAAELRRWHELVAGVVVTLQRDESAAASRLFTGISAQPDRVGDASR